MVDARSCFAGILFLSYLFGFGWRLHLFFSHFFFLQIIYVWIYWLGTIVKFLFLLCKCSLSLQKILLFPKL